MKVIAESRQPSVIPYVHLGYLATTSVKPLGSAMVGGIIAVVIGACLTFALVASRASSFRRSVMACVGGAVILVGVLLLMLSLVFGKTVYDHANSITQIHIMQVSDYMDSYRGVVKDADLTIPSSENPIKKVPVDPGQYDLKSATGATGSEQERLFSDGWGKPLQLEVVREKDQLRYVLRSAGEDGKLGTADDILSRDYPK